ncbi:MAG: T9SS type A sorting domain-containing protein, partial [Gemmatimonadetes bacterium]|nr:T9SS type A sorting domain-containing protein [Gemmatimonadota bacterium]
AGGGAYSLASVPAGSYTFRAKVFGYNALEKTVSVPAGGSLTVDFDLNPTTVVADDYESGPGTWTVTGNATTGQWELGDPQPTDGGNYQTGDDHTPAPGVNAWITELAAGSGIGSFDVDNGTTTLTSPVFSVLGLTDPHVSYYRWYQTGGGGNSTSDFWVAEISSDAGGSWTTMDTTDQGQVGWIEIDRSISSLVTPSGLMQFRFTAQDTGAGSLTEAGLDDFMVYDVETDGGAVDAPNVTPTTARTLELSPATPNPFRAGGMTSLAFSLPQTGPIRADVFDVSGRRVMTLADGVFDAGAYRLDWDGRTHDGAAATTGVYFLRLQTEAGMRSQKMVLMR